MGINIQADFETSWKLKQKVLPAFYYCVGWAVSNVDANVENNTKYGLDSYIAL